MTLTQKIRAALDDTYQEGIQRGRRTAFIELIASDEIPQNVKSVILKRFIPACVEQKSRDGG